MLVEWMPEYSLGNNTLDEQHKELFRLCQQLACQPYFSPSENSTYHEILNLLIDKSRKHFLTEEMLLKAGGFPNLVEHQKSHAKHELELCKLVNEVMNHRLDNSVITSSIVHWFLEHMQEDVKHRDYVKGNNNE